MLTQHGCGLSLVGWLGGEYLMLTQHGCGLSRQGGWVESTLC